MDAKLIISRYLWLRLVWKLRRAGGGVRESGGFLLANAGSTHVREFIAYDELCDGCLDTGYIKFNGSGYLGLAERCKHFSLRVVADVHTHPSEWTDQSEADRSHPMMGRFGHIGLIVPNYAQHNSLSLRGVGAFEYLGNQNWRSCADEIHLKLW